MNEKLNIALIYGSNREGRLCETVGKWAGSQILAHGVFSLDVIDPVEITLPHRHESIRSPEMIALGERLKNADVFIFVVPEYNHSFPAVLKFIIDSFQEPWFVKPVGFVSYGAMSGGIRAVEQLRQVFGELHAMCVRASVPLPRVWKQFNEQGQLRQPEFYDQAMKILLKQLEWWGSTLKEARQSTTRPYREMIS